MKEFMATLAEHYQVGIAVLSSVVIITYILVSVFALLIKRKYYGDLSIMGVIPILHIYLLFSGYRKKKYLVKIEKNKKLEEIKKEKELKNKETEETEIDKIFDDIF